MALKFSVVNRKFCECYLTGQAIPVVSGMHKSSDFICLLRKFDEMYPEGDIIRIICGKHSVHKSKEVQNYLATRPEGRFVFGFTPTHGSWLNLIESFFSKMTKQMLKGIRVKSKEELAKRPSFVPIKSFLSPEHNHERIFFSDSLLAQHLQ